MPKKYEQKALKAKVINTLKNFEEKYPCTISDLNSYIGCRDDGPTKPRLRRLIRSLIDEGYPIGSNGYGYYYIRNSKQLQKYMNSLQDRMAAISQRIASVHDAYYNTAVS